MGQDDLLSGLYFASHETIQDRRTSLNLTPSGPRAFPDGFSLEMEANFRNGDGFYGYVFRIIGNGDTNIDLVSNLASPSANFWLVVKDKVLFSLKWEDIPEGSFDRWIKINLTVDTRDGSLTLWFNGKTLKTRSLDIKELNRFEMSFGACRNPAFLNTNVAPMSLRNIRIRNTKQWVVNEWKLSKHRQNRVFDEIDQSEASVENPVWNIDNHLKWRKVVSLKTDTLLGITADEEGGRLFLADTRALYILSTRTFAVDTLPYAGGRPYVTPDKQMLYNRYTQELWSYHPSGSPMSIFRFDTNRWSLNPSKSEETDLWHHNRFISPTDSSLVILFGYGHYTYKSLMHRFDRHTNRWNQTDYAHQIPPRYLSSTGLLNRREALIFGGYGSKTGRQELSPEFYYDLYSFDLEKNSFKKIWTLEPPSTPFVPCASLIVDRPNSRFFTLLYNSGSFATTLRLAQFGLEKNDYLLFNDSIPYRFLDTQSWCSLYLDSIASRLIAVTEYNSEVTLYTMAYPPLMPEEVYQSIRPVRKGTCLLLIGLSAVVLLWLVWRLRNRKKRAKWKPYANSLEPKIYAGIEPFARQRESAIYFMGGFQVFDRNGRNITPGFSPTLQQLFLYILLHTDSQAEGVSSLKLDEALWSNKIGDSARNNRNVNIKKLRTLLDELDEVSIRNEKSFWKADIGPSLFCDYLHILSLLKRSKNESLTKHEIMELLSLLLPGTFLPDIATEWIEPFKVRFTEEIVSGLSHLAHNRHVKDDPGIRYHLAGTILQFDHLNDEALAIKCAILYNRGNKAAAKNLYDSFVAGYRQKLGIEYSEPFEQVICRQL